MSMNLFEKLRYQMWPVVKVWSMFTWWRIRYGGAKNIPKELLAERMEKNIARTRESLMNALRAMPDDATEEERNMLFEAMREHDEVERLYREGLKEKNDAS